MRIFLAFLICLWAGNASAMMGLMVGDDGASAPAPTVVTVYPAGDGDYSGTWTPSTGATNYGVVDESTDDDGDYASSQNLTGGQYLYFTFPAQSIPAGSTDISVKIYYRAYEPSGGTNNIRAAIKVNGTLYGTTDSGVNPPTIFGIVTESYTFVTNPNTSAAWTVDDVNSTGASPLQQFGINSSDASPLFYLTQCYMEVTYTAP